MANQWSITLNNGHVIPGIGLGTLQVGGKAVDVAIRAGYRHLDGAYMYNNEKEIGEVLQTLYKEGVVKREDMFLTSKLSSFHMTSKQDVFDCCEEVLKNLQTDYLDLFLIHGPFSLRKGSSLLKLEKEDITHYNEATIANIWEAMEELVERKKVRSIGISNFTITKTENLLKTAKIVPAVNQVECHPFHQQQKLQAYSKTKGIHLEAYGPIGAPGRWMIDSKDPVVLEDPLINEIAKKHNASPAQICISFLLHLGMIVLPKSATDSRIIENFKAKDLKLSDEDVARLKELDRNLHLYKSAGLFFTTEDEMWDIESDKAYKI